MFLWYEFNIWCNLFDRPDQTCKIKNQPKINSPRDTNWRMHEIVINNCCNTQLILILCEKRDGKFNFKGKFLSRLTNPVELSQEWVLKFSSIRIHSFTIDGFMRHKKYPLKSLQDVQKKEGKVTWWS